MPIATTQDFVKGLDFTGLAIQTAAEHNQIIELAQPYGVSDETGVGLVLTTTDTALGVADIPDPTVAGYEKWKRYIWNRRQHASAPAPTNLFYGWNDGAVADVSGVGFLQWVVVDPASQTTSTSALGTPLQTTIDDLTTLATNASVDAAASLVLATANTTDIGDVAGTGGGVPLQAQLTPIKAELALDTAAVAALNAAVSGNSANVTDTGGINGQIIALQAAVAAGDTSVPVTDIVAGGPSTVMRTKVDGSGVEWRDMSASPNLIKVTSTAGNVTLSPKTLVTSPATPALTQGTFLVFAILSGYYAKDGGGAATHAYLKITVGAVVLTGAKSGTASGAGDNFPITLTLLDSVIVPAAGANVTVQVYADTTLTTSGVSFNLMFVRL